MGFRGRRQLRQGLPRGQRQSDPNPDADRYTNADAYPDAQSYADGNSLAYSNCNTIALANADSDRNAHPKFQAFSTDDLAIAT
jgi:hypothetical protein